MIMTIVIMCFASSKMIFRAVLTWLHLNRTLKMKELFTVLKLIKKSTILHPANLIPKDFP